EDSSTVRFGFVIVAPEYRGKGFGRQMIRLAANYVKYRLKAGKITLGVFENNERAKECYYSAGFRLTGESKDYSFPVGDWKCVEMSLNVDDIPEASTDENIQD
ncbi:MAG: GNAT family N-acetyltransferase, partial [Ruminiclostridium sp.]|nr:GNAT family N-acetyltransferase [Ruminiclostridium sp.]